MLSINSVTHQWKEIIQFYNWLNMCRRSLLQFGQTVLRQSTTTVINYDEINLFFSVKTLIIVGIQVGPVGS